MSVFFGGGLDERLDWGMVCVIKCVCAFFVCVFFWIFLGYLRIFCACVGWLIFTGCFNEYSFIFRIPSHPPSHTWCLEL